MEDYPLALSNDSARVEQVQHGLESYLRGNGVRLRIASALNLVAANGSKTSSSAPAVTARLTPLLLSCLPSVSEVLRICGMEKTAPHSECIEAARRWVQ